MPLNKIVVGYDDGEPARRALDRAAEIAEAFGASIVVNNVPPSAIVILVRPVAAGPVSTAPVLALNCEPWHGQTITFAEGSYSTVQPACGHTASKARNVPERGWTTISVI